MDRFELRGLAGSRTALRAAAVRSALGRSLTRPGLGADSPPWTLGRCRLSFRRALKDRVTLDADTHLHCWRVGRWHAGRGRQLRPPTRFRRAASAFRERGTDRPGLDGE